MNTQNEGSIKWVNVAIAGVILTVIVSLMLASFYHHKELPPGWTMFQRDGLYAIKSPDGVLYETGRLTRLTKQGAINQAWWFQELDDAEKKQEQWMPVRP